MMTVFAMMVLLNILLASIFGKEDGGRKRTRKKGSRKR